MVQIPQKNLTLAEFLKLPETKPASEYIDGQIIQKPMPQGQHSRLQGKLVTAINAVTEAQKIALAFPELRCTFGGRSTVPDVAVFTWERIPKDDRGRVANRFEIAPDWSIEILSPEQSQNRVTRNLLHGLKHGTELGWIIDPDDETVLTYPAGQSPEFFEEPADVLPVPDFAIELQLTLGNLFAWLKL